MKSKISFLIFILFVFACGLALGKFQKKPTRHDDNLPEYTSQMSTVFHRAYFDLATDHNQFLDVFSKLQEKRLIDNSPKALIQVDYHSDMYRDNAHLELGYESVGNWVNVLISKSNNNGQGVIDEIYWILPDATKEKNQKKVFWDHADSYTDGLFRDGPADQTIYVENSTGRIYFYPIASKTVRQIQFHKRLLNELPSFRSSGKQIILSIDADFFDYNGYQSDFPFNHPHVSGKDFNQQLELFIKKMYEKDIRPVLVVCSRSSDYTAGYGKTLEKFFRLIGLNSKSGTDYLLTYQHNASRRGSYKSRFIGKNTERTIDSQNMFDLNTIDMVYGNYDKKIDIRNDNFELDMAIDLLAKNRGLSKDEATKYLNSSDKSDGNIDQVINLFDEP